MACDSAAQRALAPRKSVVAELSLENRRKLITRPELTAQRHKRVAGMKDMFDFLCANCRQALTRNLALVNMKRQRTLPHDLSIQKC